jgi:hypothetical protein
VVALQKGEPAVTKAWHVFSFECEEMAFCGIALFGLGDVSNGLGKFSLALLPHSPYFMLFCRQLICDVSRKEFQVIYDRLDVCVESFIDHANYDSCKDTECFAPFSFFGLLFCQYVARST